MRCICQISFVMPLLGMVMALCEFDVVELDVRSGLVGVGVIGWSRGRQ